jgi:hypothetical protein
VVCGLHSNLQSPQPGCEVVTSISSPRATVVYTLTYPDAPGAREALGTPSLRQTFKDIADPHGYSAHAFAVRYVPPAGAAHGSPQTIVWIAATAWLADGTQLQAAPMRFVVMP